jgi:hypothetical protein
MAVFDEIDYDSNAQTCLVTTNGIEFRMKH